MGKPTIYIGENKGADQLRRNCEADQRLCFRYSDSTIPLLSKSQSSSLQPSSVTVQPGLCRTCSETTLLVFPRGGSFIIITKLIAFQCLAAGSSILNREVESASMRPLARALTKNLDSLRCILRDQSLKNVTEYTERVSCNKSLQFTTYFKLFMRL